MPRPTKKPRPIGVSPLGDAGVYVEFSEKLDLALNAAAQEFAATVRAQEVAWIRDVVPALGGVALHFDLSHASLPELPMLAAAELIERCLTLDRPRSAAGRLVTIPVCYDPEFALDLVDLAASLGLDTEEVIRRHGAREYVVLMMGFAPGHPYLGGLDPGLAAPRRASPRAAVPAGSIAVANEQCVVYPYAIPGGWNVIGRTPLVVFDADRDEPSLLAARDRVCFVPISRAGYDRIASGDARAHPRSRPRRLAGSAP